MTWGQLFAGYLGMGIVSAISESLSEQKEKVKIEKEVEVALKHSIALKGHFTETLSNLQFLVNHLDVQNKDHVAFIYRTLQVLLGTLDVGAEVIQKKDDLTKWPQYVTVQGILRTIQQEAERLLEEEKSSKSKKPKDGDKS